MKPLFVFTLSALLMFAQLASATMKPDESAEDYYTRMRIEMPKNNFVCGNGICEGLEQDTCAQDCALLNAATTTTITNTGPEQSQLTYLLAGAAALVLLVAYNFLKMNRAK